MIDDRTILIQVGGPPFGWTRVTNVAETSSEVRITVESLALRFGASTAFLKRYEFVVRLAQPLGDRIVVDREGHAFPQPTCWDNTCSPLPSPSSG